MQTLLDRRMQGWRLMPRDARDTLFQLVVIGWTVLPHLSHLPPWCGALTLAVLTWRAQLALKGGALPSRWVIGAVLVLAMALTFWSQHTLFGKDAGVTLLVVLLALKTLELRARRDALVVFFLGFFLALTHCLYSQSMAVALAMGLSAWGLLTALVLAHMPVGRPPLRQAAMVAARSALLGLPLMVALFMLFPRIGPLWGMPQDALGRTGLSGNLRLGGVAEVANDDSIAFRIRFDGLAPPPEQLYFRGPVLVNYDGLEWRRSPTTFGAAGPLRASPSLRLIGPPVRYEMTLEPIRLPLLPLLEATPDHEGARPKLEGYSAQLRQDLQWQTDQLVIDRLRFSASAWMRYELNGRVADSAELREALKLPPGSNPRIRNWALEQQTTPELMNADARGKAAALMRHIRRQDFVYTLAPGEYGRDAVDEFWFDRRQGFCEHFAASFVVAMRAMGVPARIVTGYQGAEARDADGWQVVRQSNAHAWAEYWQSGLGWLRADPTAAVAPERVRLGQALAPPPNLVAGALRSLDPALALRVRGWLELVDNRWNQWVLGYSRTQQFHLLENLGIQAPNWQDLALAMAALVALLGGAGAAWAWFDRRRQDPWQRLHGQLREALSGLGVDSRAHHAPMTLARLVRFRLGLRGEPLARCLDELDRLRYARGARELPGKEWQRTFARELRELKRPAGVGPRFPQPQQPAP